MEAQTVRGEKFLYLPWNKMGRICFSLAKKILPHGEQHHRLIALAKGGWTWARAMADYLAIKKIGSIQYEFYTDIAKTKGFPTLKQSLPISVENEKLLVFDDIVDSGGTLSAAVDYLKNCGAASVATAALFFKPRSKFTPDFYAEQTDAWVIFPHEIREAVEQLSEKWQKAGMDIKQIKNNFTKIGLPKEQVEYFLNS